MSPYGDFGPDRERVNNFSSKLAGSGPKGAGYPTGLCGECNGTAFEVQ